MPIVAARRYHQGIVIEPALAIDGEPARPGPDEFDWIGVQEASEAELELLRRQYDLHPLAIEDALNQRNAPKAEAFGDQLFVIARTAAMDQGELIAYGQTAVFLGGNFIITVRHGSARAHLALRAQLEAAPHKLAQGPDRVLHALLDFIAAGYVPLLTQLEEAVSDMEEGAIAAFPDKARIRRIFRMRRQLRRFETVVGPMEEVAAKLGSTVQPAIDDAARPYFRDVYDQVRRTIVRARALTETLANIVEIASLLAQHRQGDITRQLAAWAAILAVPTAIAGIYGMNFDVMPELRWQYGYPAVLAAITLICGVLFRRFRRIGWL
jgi:magnesium transporter